MRYDGKTFEEHIDAIKEIHRRETEGIKEREHKFFEMGRDNWERNMNMIGHALVLLRKEKSDAYPKGCWCDSCLNNPNVTEHTEACKVAQATLNLLGYEPKDPFEKEKREVTA